MRKAAALIFGSLALSFWPLNARASSGRSSEALSFMNRALDAYKSGNAFGARKNADAALDDDSQLAEAYWLKALLDGLDGNVDEARVLLMRGDAARPRLEPTQGQSIREEAVRLITLGPKRVTGHFQLQSSGKVPEAQLSALQPALESAYTECVSEFGINPSTISITVYGPDVSWEAWKTPLWWTGFFDSRTAPYHWRTDDPPGGEVERQRRLRHVLAHAFLDGAAKQAIPLWFDEGVASACETPVDQRRARLEEIQHFLEGVPPIGPNRFDAVFAKRGASSAEMLAAERSSEAAVLDLMIKDPKFLSKLTASLSSGNRFDQALKAASGS